MITMSELIEDPVYRRFLETKPVTPPHSRDKKMQSSPPWTVWVQRESGGSWGKKSFWKYSEAFKFMRKALKMGVHDAAINNKRVAFKPPYRLARIRGKYVVGSDGIRRQATKRVPWKPRLPSDEAEHLWCPYCRRPTIFRFYRKHRAMVVMDPTIRRCCICGCSERLASGR